jgi:hypothetical protein
VWRDDLLKQIAESRGRLANSILRNFLVLQQGASTDQDVFHAAQSRLLIFISMHIYVATTLLHNLAKKEE